MRRWTVTLFGLAVIASGCWRYFGQEGGDKGLWFGVVMGTLALLAALSMGRRPAMATLLAWISVLFVGGWFGYEALIKKGWADAEPRQLIVLGCSIVTAGVLLGRRP